MHLIHLSFNLVIWYHSILEIRKLRFEEDHLVTDWDMYLGKDLWSFHRAICIESSYDGGYTAYTLKI